MLVEQSRYDDKLHTRSTKKAATGQADQRESLSLNSGVNRRSGQLLISPN